MLDTGVWYTEWDPSEDGHREVSEPSETLLGGHQHGVAWAPTLSMSGYSHSFLPQQDSRVFPLPNRKESKRYRAQ